MDDRNADNGHERMTMTITPQQLRELADKDRLEHTNGDVWEALHDAADLIESLRSKLQNINEKDRKNDRNRKR